MVAVFEWSETPNFLNRETQRIYLDQWWSNDDKQPLNLYGRRRVGKSWLFRRFAHGKPALILVARRGTEGKQLTEFAEQLEPLLGVRPDLPSVPALFRVLLRAAHDDRILVVLDEFPYLLPAKAPARNRVLSEIAAVLEEERDESKLKLVLCGSTVSVMAALQEERNPTHGRLTPLEVRPLPYEEAGLFLSTLKPVDRFERYAIAGGMPRYLSLLGSGELRDTVCRQLIDHNAPLFDEVKTALAQEMIEAGTHFALLELLASGDKEISELASALRKDASELSPYLKALEDLDLVAREVPVKAPRSSRSGHWHLTDPFFAFWFRFVFPYQDGLESGLLASHLFDAEVAPVLNDHVGPIFEEWCRRWTRSQYGVTAPTIGRWWGNALNEHRLTGKRSSEEIDIVGFRGSRVKLVGEAKWQNKPMSIDVVTDLDTYKLPALTQDHHMIAKDLEVLLFSRSGYTPSLQKLAETDQRLVLVDVPQKLDGG